MNVNAMKRITNSRQACSLLLLNVSKPAALRPPSWINEYDPMGRKGERCLGKGKGYGREEENGAEWSANFQNIFPSFRVYQFLPRDACSAKRGIDTVSRPSVRRFVCLSVCL